MGKRTEAERKTKKIGERRLKDEKYAYVDIIKTMRGCESCGERNPCVLDFHHKGIEEKKATIPKLIKDGYSWDIIEREINKCKVLCANCHRKTHPRDWQRKHSKYAENIEKKQVPRVKEHFKSELTTEQKALLEKFEV